MKVYKKLAIVGIGVVVLTLGNVTNAQGNEKVNLNQMYARYNQYRTEKMELESYASKYEINAIFLCTGIKQWNPFGVSQDKTDNVLGEYTNLDQLYTMLNDNRSKHESYYKKYQENEQKPIEEQEDLKAPTTLDYLSISTVSINYYYDKDKEQLAQVIRIVSPDKVYRCTVIYGADGTVKNYLEI
jgi:predicted MPP superfamily phosphohydrolase